MRVVVAECADMRKATGRRRAAGAEDGQIAGVSCGHALAQIADFVIDISRVFFGGIGFADFAAADVVGKSGDLSLAIIGGGDIVGRRIRLDAYDAAGSGGMR